MNVAVLSFFRNSAVSGQAERFMAQAAALRDELHERGDRMRLIAVWGDCVDSTLQVLIDEGLRYGLALTLVEHSHGGPVFGSTEHPERLRLLSALGNAGLVTIRNQDDAVFYVESDLLWSPMTVRSLLANLEEGVVDIVAPLIFAGTDETTGKRIFYDIFCFRKGGARFSPFHPYHPDLHASKLTPVDSIGSAFVMTGAAGRDCRIIDDNVLMGFCKDATDKGYIIAVDPTQQVNHP